MSGNVIDIPPNQVLDEDETICVEERIEYYIQPHRHHFFEIVYILDGSGVHVIGGQQHKVTAGDLMFIDYKQSHIVNGSPSFKLINVMFLPEFVDSSLKNAKTVDELLPHLLPSELRISLHTSIPVLHFRGKELKEVESVIYSMFREYEDGRPGFLPVLRAYMKVLFMYAARAILAQAEKSPGSSKKKIPPEAFEYINNNCFGVINLPQLAERYFYSASYFSHLFKETCGKSLTEYIKERRIAEACRLLCETTTPIADICKTVGYNNRKLFNKFFKQITGITPTAYRARYVSILEFSD